MKRPSILTASIALLSTLSLPDAGASTSGRSISVNFGSNGPNASLAATDVAGVIPTRNWNNAPGNIGSLFDLVQDNLGVASVVSGSSVNWSGSGTWTTDQEDNTSQFTGADEILMAGYLDNFTGNAGSILFSGLPNGLYDIYVYSLTAVNNRDSGNIIVNGIQEKSISAPSTSFFEGGGPGGPQDTGGIPGNYNFYPNVNVTNGQVNITLPGDTFRAAVNGVELVIVPEPSSMMFAALTGAGLLGWRRRRPS